MKVLIVHDYGGRIGGAEHMSLALRDGLRSRGHEAALFASTAEPLAGLENQADFTTYGSTRWRQPLQVFNPWAAADLRRVLAAYRPDVVHVRMFLTQLSPLILPVLLRYKRRTGARCLLHLVNYNLICPINTKTLPDGSPCRVRPGRVCHATGCLPWVGVARWQTQAAMLRRWLTATFDIILANSGWVAERVKAEGVPVNGFVWNGVPERAARPPLPADAPPTAVFAGRMVDKKGTDVLLRAFTGVTRRVPGSRLLLAGDGPERGALVRLADELGVASAVQFLGHVGRSEMEEAFAGGWVQAVPSLWEEPFGIVAAEAMMRGTAVVTSDAGGLAEQVVHNQTGYAVPPGDVEGLADALSAILCDRDLAERMGTAGRQRALATFTQDRFVEHCLSWYPRPPQPPTS